MNKQNNILTKIVEITEKYLTKKNVNKYIKYEKLRKKRERKGFFSWTINLFGWKIHLDEWGEAFLWAAMVVLLINQYFFQAYQIPSGSMINTLLVGDRIFVNKMIYGPELIPGAGKLPSVIKPQRGEVVIFESPTYLSNGPVFDIVQRVLFMLTFSLVDIDKDEQGNPKPHFLIKRAVGVGGDRIRNINGNLEIRAAGTDLWIDESEFNQLWREKTPVRRLIRQDRYDLYKKAAKVIAYSKHNIALASSDSDVLGQLDLYSEDFITFNEYRSAVLYTIEPQNMLERKNWRKSETGWYIPDGWIFPLGDNRDNSKDGRTFGPVRLRNVLGKAMIKYWPWNRVGAIK